MEKDKLYNIDENRLNKIEKSLKENNDAHNEFHSKLSVIEESVNSAKSISSAAKSYAIVLASFVVVLLGIIANYSRMSYTSVKENEELRIKTYKVLFNTKVTLDSVNKKVDAQWESIITFYNTEFIKQQGWTHGVYDTVIRPNVVRSKINSKKLDTVNTHIKFIDKRLTNLESIKIRL